MEHKEYLRIVEGSRTAVLMIHGIAGTPNHFRDLLPLIPGSWSLYNLLLDGHGKGVAEFAATSMEKWKAQVETRINELLAVSDRVLIVAHSMGTLFSIQAAVRHPDQIAGLFLLGVPMRPHVPPATALAAIKNALGIVKDTDAKAIALGSDCGVELSPHLWKYLLWIPRFLELFREISRTKKLLPRLAVPCRTYQSRRDELVSFSSCRDLEGHPHIQNTVLPDSGHFGYGEKDLALLQDHLRDMITKLEP